MSSAAPSKTDGEGVANGEPPRRSLEEIKAEARAFALSTSKSRKRKIVPTQLTVSNKRSYGRGFAAPPYLALNTAGSTGVAPNPVGAVLPTRTPLLSSWNGDAEFVDDEYAKFVKILSTIDEDPNALPTDDDEEEEFQLLEEEEEEDDEEDEEEESVPLESANTRPSPRRKAKGGTPGEKTESLDVPENFYRELEEELGWLEEEDIEAAVATLLDYPALPASEEPTGTDNDEDAADEEAEDLDSPEPPPEVATTPYRTASRTTVTPKQEEQLRNLLQKHHQLLLQQAVLAVRAANAQQRLRYFPGVEMAHWAVLESSDWVEIVDSAAEMLQDLDQNRKDAIRYQIQLESSMGSTGGANPPKARRSLFSDFLNRPSSNSLERRLTRAQFTKKLLEPTRGEVRTVFDIPGLSNLSKTFLLLDRSVDGVQKGDQNILEIESNTAACEQVLRYSEATIDPILIPGSRDVSENFVDATEFFGEGFRPPCNVQQESILRKNRNYFTAGEDNLVLRGVNLYGEKQWLLIADRFLPERSVNIISQRYSKLSSMLFKVHGVSIDKDGNLSPPPKLESVDDLDENLLINLHKVPPPAILNVHRWSMEEDITLLKAVAMMGSMWAEIRARLIPHRDRGHLRKRYQVLERRIKAAASRAKKHEKLIAAKLRSQVASSTAPQFPSRANTAAPSSYPALTIPNRTVSGRSLTSVAKAVSVKLSKGPTRQVNQALQSNKVKAADAKQRPKGTSDAKAASVKTKGTVPPFPYPAPPYPHPPHPYHPAYMYPPPPGYPPYVPYGYYSPYYPPGLGYGDEGSRTGFELLVADPSRGWSQMAHVKSMMENETEVASTIVTQLAKSPSKPPSTKTPVEKDGKSPAQKNQNDIEESVGSKTSTSYRMEKSLGKSKPPSSPPGTQALKLSPPSNYKASNGGRMFPESPYLYPHSEFSHNIHSMNGYDLNRVFSNAAHVGTEIATNALTTPENSRLLGDDTHLLDTDLEAVSALNLLKSPSKLSDEYKRNEPSVTQASVEKKSLFAKVVGNLNDKEKLGAKGKKKAK